MPSYLKSFVAGTALVLLALSGVNWLVDPFAIYSSPRIARFNLLKPSILKHGRIFKTVVATRGDWDVIILGTSRADVGLDPAHPVFAGRRCFNASTSNQTHEETQRMLEAVAASGVLKQAIIALDFFASNPRHGEIPDYETANFKWWRPLQVAVSGDTLKESYLTVQRQNREMVLRDYGLWLADGRREFSVRSGHREAALGSDEAYIRSHFLFPYKFSYEGIEPLSHIRDLLAFAHARGIDLKLLISPSHARQWETLAVDGLWTTWEEWKRRLVAMNEEEAGKAGRAPFALWDFSGYSAITMEPFPPAGSTAGMKWYWESSHFKKEAGDVALNRIFGRAPVATDFGVLLTTSNIDSHLEAMRSGRAAWVSSHPEDVGEIEHIAASYAKKYQSNPNLTSQRQVAP